MATDAAAGIKSALLGAARAILRPLVRQLIAHGVTYPAFSRLVKEVYIEVGTRHFTLAFKKQTDSRVALITGITRKEIGQLRRGQAPDAGAAIAAAHTLPARVVSRWLAGPPYTDAAGAAYELPYESERSASFVELASELGGDIPPRAVLDELLRVGAATLTPRGNVRLAAPAYVPAGDAAAQLALLGPDAADLIAAALHNLEHHGDAAFIQRSVRYDHVGAEALPAVRARLRALGGDFTQSANQVLSAVDRDRTPDAPGGRRHRAVAGVYYFEAPLDDRTP
ncbi:MAG: DUF6502 family protein [bacterium]